MRTRTLFVTIAAGMLIGSLGPIPSAVALVPAPGALVDLGQASTYAVFSSASVANTVSAPGAPYTTLRGDLGVRAIALPLGFPPGVVTGTTRVGATADQAYADLLTAYTEVAARPAGTAVTGDLGGKTLTPGLYSAVAAAVSNTGTVILDGAGDPNAVFVFQIGGALTMAAGAKVMLSNGARASRVFWQVNGAAAIGAGAKFAGTIMALGAVAIGAGTVVNGRALALGGAASLDSNEFYSAPPVVSISGGATVNSNDSTATISGTTDVVAPAVVTVTVAGQTLTATPFDGTWSVTTALLANGTYPVVASTLDGAGNPGTATQQLTINTVPPVVTLDGGASAITNSPTPTIAGTSDVAAGTVVYVTVGSQTLTALVQPGGAWNVRSPALTDGIHSVAATVTDPAGNQSTASQTLTITTVAPAVTITGGANALTNDGTPLISGTATVAPGTTVTVTLADETLTGLVQAGGGWTVTAAALADGPHRVIMSVSDAAGNGASLTQTLTVDTVSPAVTITGGATATTNDLDPTIKGTSEAAPGTTLTISIAGQSMTTLVQANGTWNATATLVEEGTWTVIASAPDPAGNVGSARQSLTIDADAPKGAGTTGTGTTGTGTTGTDTTGAGTTGPNGAIGPAPPPGYWMATANGQVFSFGAAHYYGGLPAVAPPPGVRHIEPTPSGNGYWLLDRSGGVTAYGDAPALGRPQGLAKGEDATSLSSTPTGHGYWVFTSLGRAVPFGDAGFFGDLSALHLNAPVIGSVATPSGHGYYMVGADGGIFSFGDARFHGSLGSLRLNKPVMAAVPTATGDGYWLVASDGGVFSFGDAPFRGSLGSVHLNQPVTGMVRFGSGYLVLGADGGVFDFSDRPFLGSLGATPPSSPVISVATLGGR
jgi:hypothetical protein